MTHPTAGPVSRARAGFTLIEMMMAILLTMLVFAITIPFFRQQTMAVDNSAGRLDALQNARYAQSYIDRELRLAGGITGQPIIVQAAAGDYVEPSEEAAEYAPQVIHSMVTGRPREIQVNVANRGFIDNLADAAPVEVPCRIDGSGAGPVAIGALPPQCAALNRTFLSVVELTVRAMTEGRPDHIRHALMVDPNTAATLSPERISDLADAMVAAHRQFLPEALAGQLPS